MISIWTRSISIFRSGYCGIFFFCLMLCLNIRRFHRNSSPFHIITLMSLALSGLLSEETGNSKGIKFIHPPIHTDEWIRTTQPRCCLFFSLSTVSCQNTYSVVVQRGAHPAARLWVYELTWCDRLAGGGHLLSRQSRSVGGLQGAERPLCPGATLPCALGLAARYIKTGASVTESAL